MSALLEVSGLAKAFGGVRAVDGVDFTVAAGEMLAIIGPNGAGKSTCFNMVGGQLRPDRGAITLAGLDIVGLPARAICRAGVGRTFQVAATFGSLSVRENVQTALIAARGGTRGLWTPAARLHGDDADRVLTRVGVEALAPRPCGELAYGDVKRVELAIALAGAPRLLLMDEPTAGMAPRERFALMDLVRRIATESRIAVLFTEHDMDVVFQHADRILVLDRGCPVASGPPAEVRENADVQRIYLGSHGTAAARRAQAN